MNGDGPNSKIAIVAAVIHAIRGGGPADAVASAMSSLIEVEHTMQATEPKEPAPVQIFRC
jgi:hypothetical protein